MCVQLLSKFCAGSVLIAGCTALVEMIHTNRFAASLSFISLALVGGNFIETIEHLDLGDTHMEVRILPAFTSEA